MNEEAEDTEIEFIRLSEVRKITGLKTAGLSVGQVCTVCRTDFA